MSLPKILRRIPNRRRLDPLLGERYFYRFVIRHSNDRNFIPVPDWVTKDAHDAFTKTADYTEVQAASRPAFGSEPTVNYVEFEDAKDALGAPITEFVTFTLKEGKNVAQLEFLVRELHQKFVGTPKFHGDSWAPIIGKPNVYHGILGWDTVKVSMLT